MLAQPGPWYRVHLPPIVSFIGALICHESEARSAPEWGKVPGTEKLYPSSVKLLHEGNEEGTLIHAIALLWKDNSCFPYAKCSRHTNGPQA